jgi:periplasmic mercuric ion binding protein
MVFIQFILLQKLIIMKTRYIVLSILFVFAALFTVKAQKYPVTAVKKENIKVWGECGMCKKKIESASVQAGAITADWNEDSKVLSVSYDFNKTNPAKIQQAIAAAGYDTRDITATNDAYNKLPGCCKYERAATTSQAATCCGNEKACSKDAACCKDGKCDKTNGSCTDMTVCKEKGCCKS